MATTTYKSRLKTHYDEVVVPKMMEEFKYKSIMQVPKVVKIALNQGVKGAPQDKKLIDQALLEMTTISGQKAVSTKSRLDISNFKLRANMPIGVRVTLRSLKMYEFMDRLISIAMPRVRDFKGTNPKSFDGRGNYTMGVTEQIIFPEIDIDKVPKITGMDITVVTTANTDAEALALLTHMGFPFKKENKNG
jgi:large subunit ribosomal protein L5